MNSRAKIDMAGRAAFTLVELMVVVGLMALLGTVSVTGYFAAVRGMSDRAVIQDTISLIRQAQQVCLIDQTPTAVLFYNRQTMTESKNVSSEEARSSTAGAAVAIKMAGRISYIAEGGNVLVDEFADWNQSSPVTERNKYSNSDVGIPFYRMANLAEVVNGGIEKCRVFVHTAVEPLDFDNEYMIAYGGQVQHFCEANKKGPKENKKFSGTTYDNGNNQRWGHRIKEAVGGITWEVGDAYGVEIASLQLPKGIIYGEQSASSAKIVSGGALKFIPSDLAGFNEYTMNLDQTITISALSGGSTPRKIGSITKNDLRDDAK